MTRQKFWPLAVALVAAVSLGGCSGSPEFDYSSERVAPERTDYPEQGQGHDTEPERDDGMVELSLDNGASVILWIDPEDKRMVYQQHSDPEDDSAWTEPEKLYEAGDGCLWMKADTNGETVAVTLGCYENDAFEQQAPDRGQAVVTEDLDEWEVDDRGEFFADPHVADNGDVTWEDS